MVAVASLLTSHTAAAQQHPPEKKVERRQILSGPALESASPTTAIITWTVDTGGGTTTHYGIVRYGTDPSKLDRTARSPNRWNRTLPDMTYLVLIYGLKPGTTYYYTVGATQADGTTLGFTSPVEQFSTRPPP
jgi:Purple acid Phosphatase, N-terminal domain